MKNLTIFQGVRKSVSKTLPGEALYREPSAGPHDERHMDISRDLFATKRHTQEREMEMEMERRALSAPPFSMIGWWE